MCGRGAAGVIRIRENRGFQHQRNKRRRIEKQSAATRLAWSSAGNRLAIHHPHIPWRAVRIAKVQRHRHDRSVQCRRSSLGRRVAHGVEDPVVLWLAVRAYPGRGIRAAKIGQRVDPSNAWQGGLVRSSLARCLWVHPRELQLRASYIRRSNCIGILRPGTNRASRHRKTTKQNHPIPAVK